MPSPLGAERWKRLAPLIDAAADLPRDRQPALLDRPCGNDAGLRAGIEHLPLHDERDDTAISRPPTRDFRPSPGNEVFGLIDRRT